MIAIAEYSGWNITKQRMVRILTCPDKSLVGMEWLLWVSDPAPEGDFFLVRFDPQDQFCHLLPLGDIKI